MTLASNPYVKTELDNLQLQFGAKALLTLDDYCALFDKGRKMASRDIKRRGVPFFKSGNELFIPIQDLALFIARKKAEQEGRIIVLAKSKEEMAGRRGFTKKAHDAQLVGRK